MGNNHGHNAWRHRDGRVSFFDMVAHVVEGKMRRPIHVPSCFDELVDWTEEATTLLHLLSEKGFIVVSGYHEQEQQHLRFVPFVRKPEAKGMIFHGRK